MAEQAEQAKGKPRGKRWTEAEAREALRDWRESGLSAAAFARRSGFSAMRLSYWEERLAAGGADDVRFVAVPVSVHSVEVEHQGVTVRFRDLSVEELARLVVAIARRAREC